MTKKDYHDLNKLLYVGFVKNHLERGCQSKRSWLH